MPVLLKRVKGELGEKKSKKRARKEYGTEIRDRILERGKMET